MLSQLAYGTFLKKLLKGAGAALPKIKALPSAPPPSTPIAEAVPLVVRVFDNVGRGVATVVPPHHHCSRGCVDVLSSWAGKARPLACDAGTCSERLWLV